MPSPKAIERDETARRIAAREERLKDLEWAFVVVKADTRQAEDMRDRQLHIGSRLSALVKDKLAPDERQQGFDL